MSCENGQFSSGAVIVSFLLGGAVGAGLAVLLTPKSGPETREKIREGAYAARAEASRFSDEIRTKAADLLDKSKEYVEEKKAILESALEAGKEAMEREKERLVSKLRQESEEQA